MTNQRKIWQHDSGGQHRKERVLKSSKGERVNQFGAVAFNGVSAVNTVQFLEFRALSKPREACFNQSVWRRV